MNKTQQIKLSDGTLEVSNEIVSYLTAGSFLQSTNLEHKQTCEKLLEAIIESNTTKKEFKTLLETFRSQFQQK